ncbi:MAG: TetR/AcrR family transcriptional regulator [Pseudomonadota bacterium]
MTELSDKLLGEPDVDIAFGPETLKAQEIYVPQKPISDSRKPRTTKTRAKGAQTKAKNRNTTSKTAKKASPRRDKSERGREAVENALIIAAGEMLAEIGPKAMSVRDVATRAGVNHGQVHHYFNGKDGLIKTAFNRLSQEHLEHAIERSGGRRMPPALTLSHDSTYVQAVVRLVLDGELGLATEEIADNTAVPRRVLESAQDSMGLKQPTVELKAALASMMLIELSWGVLSEYVLTMVDAKPSEAKQIREMIIRSMMKVPDALDIDIPSLKYYENPSPKK